MSANQLDAFGLRAIFAEFSSNDQALNQGVKNAISLVTTPVGGSVFKSSGAKI